MLVVLVVVLMGWVEKAKLPAAMFKYGCMIYIDGTQQYGSVNFDIDVYKEKLSILSILIERFTKV